MKLNMDFVLREIAGEYMLIPVGSGAEVNGMIVLNKVGADIWKYLSETCERDYVLAKLIDQYDAPEETLAKDLDAFLVNLKEKHAIKDE